nr:hypothetical protein [Tanacetum cinerariifolium]
MFLNVEQLEKQLDKEDFQELGSMAAFNVLEIQFQAILEFRDTPIQHLESVKKSINERAQNKREYESWVNERQMQTTEEKVDTSKALDASLVDTKSSRTESKEQDTSNRSGNDAHDDDADIRPIYDEEPMVEVQTTAKINVFAIGQHHTKQPGFNNKEPQFASQVDVYNDLSKPVTTHYLPKEREAAYAKPHHMIASSNSRISSKNMPRFSSNDMVYNHYLEEAKKKTQEHNRNSEPSLMASSRSQSTPNEICLCTVSSSLEHLKLSQDGECCSFLKFVSSGCFHLRSLIFADKSDKEFFVQIDQERDCKENSNIFSQGIELRGVAIHISTFLKGDQIDSGVTYILIEQGCPKEDLCMIAFQPPGVSVWEGAEAVHLQAEETKMEYSRNVVTNSRETPSWREIVSLTVLVKLASFTWKPTGRIFMTVGLRWVPTGKIFASSTTKVDNEPLNGSNADITNQYECEQTLDVSACILNLSAGTSFNLKKEGLRVWSELGLHDHINEQSSSKLVPKVVPPVDKTVTS